MTGATWLKAALAFAGSVLTFIFGAWDTHIIVLIVMVAIDYITGVIACAIEGTLCSSKGFSGLLKKLVIFLLVAVATITESFIPGTNGALRTAVILFYIVNEALSVLENAGRMGIPLPRVLVNAIKSLHEKKSNTRDNADADKDDRPMPPQL